jgi:HAD superfamily hydrolase (TIGR01549 family)
MNLPSNVSQKGIDIYRVKGLLFDIDGTLSDTDDHMVNRLVKLLRPIKWMFRDHDPQPFARWLVMASETPANFVYGVADRLGIDKLYAKIYNRSAQRKPSKRILEKSHLLIPGVKHMLETLYGRYPLGVVSARDERTSVAFLEAFSLKNYFEIIVTAQTCPHTKPYPDPIEYAADKLGIAPEACVMIGDTVVDVKAGNAAGAQTIAVQCGFGTHRELEKAGADIILAKTPDILDIFS